MVVGSSIRGFVVLIIDGEGDGAELISMTVLFAGGVVGTFVRRSAGKSVVRRVG